MSSHHRTGTAVNRLMLGSTQRHLCFLLVAVLGVDASMRPLGRERGVGRNLQPRRDRSLIAAPNVKGEFLTPTVNNSTRPSVPTALLLPLWPSELGAYITTLTFGDSPSNMQTVSGLIDTGSGIVHFPCQGCVGNGCDRSIYPDLEYYDSSTSPSFQAANCSDVMAPFLVYGTQGGSVNAINCTWFMDQDSPGQVAGQLNYAGGNSASFLFFRDTTSVGFAPSQATLPPFEPLLACDFEASASSFGAGFSGIFGMNFQPGSLYSQVVSSYNFANEMTFCLGDGEGSAGRVISEQSGVLAFGAVKLSQPPPPAKVWETPLAFTPGSGWYTGTSFINVGVVGLYVAGVAVLNPVGKARPLYNFFLDTGNPWLVYPPALLTPLRSVLIPKLLESPVVDSVQDNVETEGRLVVTYKNASRSLSNAEKDMLFPTIYFQFDGTGKVPFRPSSYLISSKPPMANDHPSPPGSEFIYMANGALSLGASYTGVLGNAWLNRMLVQVKQDAVNGGGSVTMSLVDQCSDVNLVAA